MRRKLAAPFSFHIDVCLGSHHLAQGLAPYLLEGERARAHVSAFPQATADEVWLPAVAADWVVLSADGSMLSKVVERDVITAHRMAVVFYPRDLRRDASIDVVGKSLQRVRGLLGARSLPMAIAVSAAGNVKVRKLS